MISVGGAPVSSSRNFAETCFTVYDEISLTTQEKKNKLMSEYVYASLHIF